MRTDDLYLVDIIESAIDITEFVQGMNLDKFVRDDPNAALSSGSL